MPSLFGDSSAFDTKATQQGYFGARLKLYLRLRNIYVEDEVSFPFFFSSTYDKTFTTFDYEYATRWVFYEKR